MPPHVRVRNAVNSLGRRRGRNHEIREKEAAVDFGSKRNLTLASKDLKNDAAEFVKACKERLKATTKLQKVVKKTLSYISRIEKISKYG